MVVANQVSDFPKIESPFNRHENDNGEYVVYDEVNDGYEWVFDTDKSMAVEKLHGTNVSVLIENGQIIGVWNRTNRIPLLSDNTQHNRIINGIRNAKEKNYVDRLPDGQHFGELVGPHINGNIYDLDDHLWYPFARAKETLRYKSWGDYPTDFDTISGWFKEGLMPLFYSKRHGMSFDEAKENHEEVEGIMFYNQETEEMAKLRRDMFEWYEGKRH